MSWFGNVKFLGVAVVLLRHTSYRLVLFSTHPQPGESCEVLLMFVTLQSRFRSALSAAVCVTQFFRDISTLLINMF